MLKSVRFLLLFFAAVALAGCATAGKNYQPEIDALNARLTALQGQLSAREQEVSALQNQLNKERDARDAEVKRRSQKIQTHDSDLK